MEKIREIILAQEFLSRLVSLSDEAIDFAFADMEMEDRRRLARLFSEELKNEESKKEEKRELREQLMNTLVKRTDLYGSRVFTLGVSAYFKKTSDSLKVKDVFDVPDLRLLGRITDRRCRVAEAKLSRILADVGTVSYDSDTGRMCFSPK